MEILRRQSERPTLRASLEDSHRDIQSIIYGLQMAQSRILSVADNFYESHSLISGQHSPIDNIASVAKDACSSGANTATLIGPVHLSICITT